MANNQNFDKKSGVTYSKITKGNFIGGTIVNAWNASKNRGLLTCTVSPYGNSKEYTADSTGNRFLTMIAVVKYHSSGVEKMICCSMNLQTKVIVLKELGMVISPNGKGKTKSGKSVKGYFGTFNNN